IGSQDTLAGVRQASSAAPMSLTWTRQVSGLDGTLWNVWTKQVARTTAGLTWAEFKQRATLYNPSLIASQHRFQANRTYVLPENKYDTPEIVWDRPLVGFAGNLYQGWQQHVENKVIGLTYADFKRSVLLYNPTLSQDRRFVVDQRYTLPRNAGQKAYMLLTVAGKGGRFAFADLPPGDYRIEATAPDALPFTTGFSAQEPVKLGVPLEPLHIERSRGDGDFVRVQGNEFVVAGLPFRFVGVNIRGLVHYGDGQTLQHAADSHRFDQLRAANDMGVRVVRVFLPSMHANVETTTERLHNLIALIKQHFPGLYILPALANLYADVPFRIHGDDSFYRDNLLIKDFFTSGYQTNYLPFVRHIVQTFRNEAQIFAWEIGNELKLDPDDKQNHAADPNLQHFIRFTHDVARQIRSLDTNHLITTGMISTRHAWLFDAAQKRQLYDSPDLDFLTIHAYQGENQEDDSPLAHELNLPFIIEEAGFDAPHDQDRSERVKEDMHKWFSLGARGYFQWGFMATQDNGDGDQRSGMDRAFHGDWDALFRVYQERAWLCAQVDPNWRPVADKPVEPETGNFTTGQQVFAQDWVNVRKSPGHLDPNKLGDDILGQIAPGATAIITGIATPLDGLVWWPVGTTLSTGQRVDGWAAQALPNAILLGATPPAGTRSLRRQTASGRSRSVAGRGGLSTGQTVYAATYINLRRDAGYVNKPGDHVIGQIAHGAAIEILGGPNEADGLTWWQVRSPLLDNAVAEGWVAEADAAGERLLRTEAPLPPPPIQAGVIGRPLQIGDVITVVAAAANIRRSPGYVNPPPDHVVASVDKGTSLTLSGGPQTVDGLEWWQVSGQAPSGLALDGGWVAVAGLDGTRLIALADVAALIQIAKPFGGEWPVSQGWGLWPEFYATITYDGVALKGHNGLDFGTPVGTPLIAVDGGTVTKVDFEPDGFGNHIVIQHAWGESL
ncbi:MAG: hypothetical protein M3Q45_12665, partial [Chloroflexota bacterium]|nr:hypothetical protein [Chloroflexota bacterium]